MALLSNSLFLDSEYEADCTYKINYLVLMDEDSKNDLVSDGVGRDKLLDVNTLLTRVTQNGSKYFSDGSGLLYTTKQISNDYYDNTTEQTISGYYKILIEKIDNIDSTQNT